MRVPLLLVLCGCTVSVSLENKHCATSEPRCLPSYVCVDGLCVRDDGGVGGGAAGGGATGGGAPGDAGCALEVDPAASSCAGTTYYLSPQGADTNPGTDALAPRLTTTGLSLQRGDVVQLLEGTYTQPIGALSSIGTASCPIVVQGARDGGTTFTVPIELSGRDLVLRDVVFRPVDRDCVDLTNGAQFVTLQRLTFAGRLDGGSSAHAATELRIDACTDCTVRECRFESDRWYRATMVNSDTPRLALRGNTVKMHYGDGFTFRGPGIVVEGNLFTGGHGANAAYLDFTGAADGVLRRNVFKNVSAQYADHVFIGGGAVLSNTFDTAVGNAPWPLVESPSRFDDNLVIAVDAVVNNPPLDGRGYNVFDGVTVPYRWPDGGTLAADGGWLVRATDRLAFVALDATEVPVPPSAAIDSADPKLAVPVGGQSIADVGAYEYGASRTSDGRYCTLDGGQ